MDQQRIWEHYQAGGAATAGMFEGAAARHEHLLGLVPRRSHVLNIGVGDGGMERSLQQHGHTAYSLDPNESSINRVRDTLGLGDRARVGVSQAMPFEADSLDVVVMSEVIEHLDDDVLASTLSEVGRVLRPGGLYIGSTPADENLDASECLCPNCGTIFHRYGHVQMFDEARLRTVLEQRFDDVQITRNYFSAGRENWKGRALIFFKQVAIRIGQTGSNETFAFVATSRA